MTTTDVQDTFQIGRVANRAVGAVARNAVPFLLISAVLTLPVLFMNIFVVGDAAPTEDVAAIMANAGAAVMSALLSIICLYLVQACLIYGTILDINGEKPQLGAMLATGLRVFVPTILISILGGLGIILGLIALIVPGVILALMWSVVIPVRVVENTGIGATFGRSRALTSGHRLKILSLILLYVLAAILVGIVVGAIVGVVTAMLTGEVLVGNSMHVMEWLVNIVIIALGAAGSSSIYYELRTVKEGLAPQQLAAAFD